jgi:hypothetical protein
MSPASRNTTIYWWGRNKIFLVPGTQSKDATRLPIYSLRRPSPPRPPLPPRRPLLVLLRQPPPRPPSTPSALIRFVPPCPPPRRPLSSSMPPRPHPPLAPPATSSYITDSSSGKLILVKCITIYLFECVILFINSVEFII